LDVGIESSHISPFEMIPPHPEQHIIGFRTRRIIRAGAVLMDTDISPAYAFQRGEPVRVHYRIKDLSITFIARAASVARCGSTGYIENPFGGRLIRAVAVSTGTASAGPRLLETGPTENCR
jgi:flagella basal body P-ring formation protein FlgA